MAPAIASITGSMASGPDEQFAPTASAPQSVIILMHSNSDKTETVKALPELIHFLRDWGYKFGVVTPMTPQPW